jgi:hypothetical protein
MQREVLFGWIEIRIKYWGVIQELGIVFDDVFCLTAILCHEYFRDNGDVHLRLIKIEI